MNGFQWCMLHHNDSKAFQSITVQCQLDQSEIVLLPEEVHDCIIIVNGRIGEDFPMVMEILIVSNPVQLHPVYCSLKW